MDEKQLMDTISSSLKAMLIEVVQNRIKIDALMKLLQDKGLITSEEANEYVSEFTNTQYQLLLNELIGAIDLILKKKT